MKIAILDDYQKMALQLADWSALSAKNEITIFNDHVADPQVLVKRLLPFDILCVMRERTPLTASIIEQLPNLKLIASTGRRNASIDMGAAEKRGIKVMMTGYDSSPTIEMTWALILGLARNLVDENNSLKNGGWQIGVGAGLRGKTMAILGLGNIGSEVAKIARAFGMNVIAWSQNLTAEKATAVGARLVTKEELFQQADFLTVHLVLSDRSRGIVADKEISLMKAGSFLINTSRGPIVKEDALVNALQNKKIAGAAVDVYDTEPLPKDHIFRSLSNLLATPHIGYVSRPMYETFYGDTVKNILAWQATL